MSRLNLLRLSRLKIWLVAFVLLGLLVWRLMFPPVYGDQLGQRAIQLSDSLVSQTAEYRLSFELPTGGTVGSVLIQFCSDGALLNTPCTAPAGFDAGSATLTEETGMTGFSMDAASTANEILLSRSASAAAVGPATYEFGGVVNPSSPGSYYVRLQTFAAEDASGPASDYGGIAFSINSDVGVTTTVPPYLMLCTGTSIPSLNCASADGDFIDFGELSARQARVGSSQMLVATNAELGYNITIGGTTLTSGNNVIGALSFNDVSRPGTAQFGLNLRANSSPGGGANPTGPGAGNPMPGYNQPNSYRFVPGDIIVAHSTTDDARKYTVSYLANVPNDQPAGIYVSTITYVGLANF